MKIKKAMARSWERMLRDWFDHESQEHINACMSYWRRAK